MTKKFLITIFLAIFFMANVSNVFSAQETSGSSVGVTASIESSAPPPPITTYALVISSASASPACDSVTLSWQTDLHTTTEGVTTVAPISASSEVHYGIASTAEGTATGTAGSSHSVSISGLTPGQTYKYYLYSTTGVYSDQTGESTFTLACSVASPSITVTPKNQGAEIGITYAGGADIARVVVRRSTGTPPASTTAGEAVYDGAETALVTDPSIPLGVTYWYSVFVCNSGNVCSDGVFDSALRLVSNASGLFAAPDNGKLSVSWSNPSGNSANDFAFATARLVRSNTALACASIGINDGDLQVEGNFSSYSDTGLTNGQTYYYKIFVKNSYGEYSSGVCTSGTPVSVEPEARCITSISAESGDGLVAISWNNPANEAGVFQLDNISWQRNSDCVSSKGQGQAVYTGTGQGFTDNGLTNNTFYSYTAFVDYNSGSTVNCGCITALPYTESDPVPIDVILPSGGGTVTTENPNYNFFVNDGALQIFADSKNNLNVLPGYSMTVSSMREDMPKDVKNIAIGINQKNYFVSLNPTTNKYRTSLNLPSAPGDYELKILTVYRDDSVSTLFWNVKIHPDGYVSLDTRGAKRISGIEVFLIRDNETYRGFRVKNPAISDDWGQYGFMAPNGQYKVRVDTEGYKFYQTGNINVENNIINRHINLDKDQSILKTTTEVLTDPETIANVTKTVIDNPVVEDVSTQYVAPVTTAAVTVSAVVAIPWWNFIHYLQYLFALPSILRRRKFGWGTVYNSITKEPVDLAAVRLYDYDTKKLLQSRVTDSQGRYNFLVEAGKYYLEVVKPDFTFPSAILKEHHDDDKYIDLYHGEAIEVHSDESGVIIANIPLDQKDIKITDKQILKKFFWEKIKANIILAGPIISVIIFLISPSIYTALLAVVQFILYAFFRRLGKVKRAKNWGAVYDHGSKKLLPGSVVRIFSPKYDKMLEVQVTDKKGRYGFLAGENIYYLTGNKDGYHEYKTNTIDLRGKQSGDIISEDISLQERKAGEEVTQYSSEHEGAKILSKDELENLRNEIKQEMQTETSEFEEQAEKIKEKAEKDTVEKSTKKK